MTRPVATHLLLISLLIVGASSCGTEPQRKWRLTVGIDSTFGKGHVVSSDSTILCPPDCWEDYDDGFEIDLTANAESGSALAVWQQYCALFGISLTGTVLMDADRQCTARFEEGRTLTIWTDPASTAAGEVSGPGIQCGNGNNDCAESYPVGRSVDLQVIVSPGVSFGGWGGDCVALGSSKSVTVILNNDLDCTTTYHLTSTGGLTPRGRFTFAQRVEAWARDGSSLLASHFDGPPLGEIVDASNISVLTSPAGAEYGTCPGARGAVVYFDHTFNQKRMLTTCLAAREATQTLTTGGASQVVFLNYAPGAPAVAPDTTRIAIADFEFGQVRLMDVDTNPQPDIIIPLTNPLERSCPFSLVVDSIFAYVVGREGVAGTSTANCDNWRGLWKVDLVNNQVVDFLPIGTKPRSVVYGSELVYVTDFEEDKVYVIDPATMTVDRTIDVGDGPVGLRIDYRPAPASNRLLVTNWNTNRVQLFDLGTDLELDDQDSGGVAPVDIILSGSSFFVLNFGDAANSIGAAIQAFSLAP